MEGKKGLSIPMIYKFSNLRSLGRKASESIYLKRERRKGLKSKESPIWFASNVRRESRLMRSLELTRPCIPKDWKEVDWESVEDITFCLCKFMSNILAASFVLVCNRFEVLKYCCLPTNWNAHTWRHSGLKCFRKVLAHTEDGVEDETSVCSDHAYNVDRKMSKLRS